MYVSLKYKFSYYRIPKTASTSMALALKPYLYKFNKTLNYPIPKFHLTPSESLHLLNTLNFPIGEDFRTVMVTRNPYTRLVSMYKFVNRMINKPVRHPIPNSMYNVDELKLETQYISTFDYFLEMLSARKNQDTQALAILNSKVYESQLLWTHDSAVVNPIFLKYEELTAANITNILGLPEVTLPRENVSPMTTGPDELKPYQKEKIYSICEEEFEAYSYKK